MWCQLQFKGPCRKLIEGRGQLKTVLEQADSAEHVQTKPGTGHGYNQSTHVSVFGEKQNYKFV